MANATIVDDPVTIDWEHRFQRWEKWALAAFLFLAKVIAFSALLLIEVSMIIKVWGLVI